MKRWNKYFASYAAGITIALFLGVFAGVAVHHVYADGDPVTIGGGQRDEHHGYFLNVHDEWGDEVFPNGMYTYNVTDFIAKIKSNMNSSNVHYSVGASFIIYTMLGKDPGNYAKPPSAANVAEWERRVRSLNSAGGITWNEAYTFERNTYYQGTGIGPNPHDDALYKVDSTTARSIVFRNSNGRVVYAIKHDCGNPVGTPRGLPDDASFNISGHTEVTYNSTTASSEAGESHNIFVPPGANVNFRHFVLNEGPSPAPAVSYRGYDYATSSYYTSGGPFAYANNQERAASRAFTVPASAPDGTKYCRRTEWQPASSSSSSWQSSGNVCVTVRIVITMSCGGAVTLPALKDSQTPFQLTTTMNFGSAAQVTAAQTRGYQMHIVVSGPGLAHNTTAAAAPGAGTTLERTVALGPTNATGTYNITYQMVDSTGVALAPLCTSTFIIANMPYFSSTSGDVAVGAGMNGQTTACLLGEHDQASIVSWNQGASAGYTGASTDYAAFALNHIQSFATATNPASGAAAIIPSGLAFANTAASGAGSGDLMGGKLGNYQSCVPNYYFPPATASGAAIAVGALPLDVTASFKYPGGAVIPTLALPNRTHVNIYVDGDAYISGPITYSGSGGYALADNIPSFSLVAKGNIYIANGVGRLDGLYVAEPDDSGNRGTIYTCATGPGAAVDPVVSYTTFYNLCHTQLTFNGSVIAKRVALLRTFGTVSQPNQAAEVFNETPELWLNQKYLPVDPTLSKSVVGRYQSVSGLPPIL